MDVLSRADDGNSSFFIQVSDPCIRLQIGMLNPCGGIGLFRDEVSLFKPRLHIAFDHMKFEKQVSFFMNGRSIRFEGLFRTGDKGKIFISDDHFLGCLFCSLG